MFEIFYEIKCIYNSYNELSNLKYRLDNHLKSAKDLLGSYHEAQENNREDLFISSLIKFEKVLYLKAIDIASSNLNFVSLMINREFLDVADIDKTISNVSYKIKEIGHNLNECSYITDSTIFSNMIIGFITPLLTKDSKYILNNLIEVVDIDEELTSLLVKWQEYNNNKVLGLDADLFQDEF